MPENRINKLVLTGTELCPRFIDTTPPECFLVLSLDTTNTGNRVSGPGDDWNSNDLSCIDSGWGCSRTGSGMGSICLFLCVCVGGTKICGLSLSGNTYIPSTEIALMPQLGCAATDNKSCSGESFGPCFRRL